MAQSPSTGTAVTRVLQVLGQREIRGVTRSHAGFTPSEHTPLSLVELEVELPPTTPRASCAPAHITAHSALGWFAAGGAGFGLRVRLELDDMRDMP